MKKRFVSLLTLLFIISLPLCKLIGVSTSTGPYEHIRIAKITVHLENLPIGSSFNQDRILSSLRTKTGDPFSQITFDQDLKTLSEEYDRVEPVIEVYQDEITISITLWQKPVIRSIKWEGNHKVGTRTLQKELGIQPHSIFSRDAFNKAFNKVKEYYVKKGYFEAELEYKIIPYPASNEVDLQINVNEGHSGHIQNISFSGLDKKDESAILQMIQTKKHNFFTSWITGQGTYHEEALEHDKLVIVNYLQNQGYANARAHIQIKEVENGKIQIKVSAVKGEKFYFGSISIRGNTLYTDEKINKALTIRSDAPYSPEELRTSIQNIKDIYGKEGYIETNVNYTLHLSPDKPVYNIAIEIEEGQQFRIGLIRVLGNVQTNKNVILRESLLVPGELFDSRRLKYTEQRLEAVGYFKSVTVYAVKTSEDDEFGENYRDVIIEVEETTTGNLSLFFGFSTIEDLFGGLDLAENNFDHRGLTSFWREGLSSLRGGGEYVHGRVQIGQKQQAYTVAWMDPYFRDTSWRFGFDATYSISHIQSDDYRVYTAGGSIFASYPLSAYWTFGTKYRLANSVIHMDKKIENKEAQRERQNSGIVTGIGTSLNFDSTDNAYKPHKGFRSNAEIELGGLHRHSDHASNFPFFRVGYTNAYYYPVWRRGTFKTRWDFKFLFPFGQGKPDLVPLSERFFLGGETTVRGYEAYRIGPKFSKNKAPHKETKDPTGGVSSVLFSLEYSQQIFKMLDGFVFFDGGSISLKQLHIHKFNMSYGVGARIELANRVPLTLGVGFPINPDDKDDVHRFFFSMGGQF